MGPWVICNSVVTEHQLWRQCHSSLFEISNRDYKKVYFKENPIINALDLDSYEKSLHMSSPQCTGDVVIGVQKVEKNAIHGAAMLLIVELRMKYKNAENLSINNLCQKIKHSKELLGRQIVIANQYYFVFEKDVAPQAKYYIERQMLESKQQRHWIVVSVDDFRENLILPTDIPMCYEYSTEAIKVSFKHCIEDGVTINFSLLGKQFEFWMEKIDLYRWNKSVEAKHIMETINAIYNEIKSSDKFDTFLEEERFDFEIYGEKLFNLQNGLMRY